MAESEWRVLLKRILRPFTVLKRSPSFFLYFIGVICFFGALGIWIPAGRLWFGSESITTLNVYHHLATYTISITVTALADFAVRNQDSNGRTFRLLLIIVMGISFLVSGVALFMNEQNYVGWLSCCGGIGAAWVWLSVHDSTPDLTDPDPYSAVGGEVSS